jgi:hypothetical protein
LWFVCAIALVVGFAVRADAAAAVRIVVPAGGERLVPGQLVEVRWERLPNDVDEMELLLELDGGAPYEVRLTPQLIGSSRSLAWEVPNLPAEVARLRLRWSRDGIEIEGEPSAVFTIVPNPALPIDGTHLDCGERWIGTGSPRDGSAGTVHGRLIIGPGDHELLGAMSENTEVAPSQTRGRRHIALQPGRELSWTRPGDPEKAARCPLSIPLRE